MGEISVNGKILETMRNTFDKDYLFQLYVKQGIRDLIKSGPSSTSSTGSTLSPNTEDASDDDDTSGISFF